MLADKLKDVLNQPVLVDNKGGADGMIATQQLKASPSNGSTVMLTIDDAHVVVPLTAIPSEFVNYCLTASQHRRQWLIDESTFH